MVDVPLSHALCTPINVWNVDLDGVRSFDALPMCHDAFEWMQLEINQVNSNENALKFKIRQKFFDYTFQNGKMCVRHNRCTNENVHIHAQAFGIIDAT